MALDIYFAEDIRNALLAANEGPSGAMELMAGAIKDLGSHEPGQLITLMRVWRHGYRAALLTVALAFGLAPADVDRRIADLKHK